MEKVANTHKNTTSITTTIKAAGIELPGAPNVIAPLSRPNTRSSPPVSKYLLYVSLYFSEIEFAYQVIIPNRQQREDGIYKHSGRKAQDNDRIACALRRPT
jgi:hypothetical protein